MKQKYIFPFIAGLLLIVGPAILSSCKDEFVPQNELEEVMASNSVPSYTLLYRLLSKPYTEVEEALKNSGYNFISRSEIMPYTTEVRTNYGRTAEDGTQLYYEFTYYRATGLLKFLAFELDDANIKFDTLRKFGNNLLTDEMEFQKTNPPQFYAASASLSTDTGDYYMTDYDIETFKTKWNTIWNTSRISLLTNCTYKKVETEAKLNKDRNELIFTKRLKLRETY